MRRVFYTLLYRPSAHWQVGKSLAEQDLSAHRAYHQTLFEAGKIVLGGGFLDNEGGLNVLNVASEAEAVAIAQNDPALLDGVMSVEVHPLFVVFRETNAVALDLSHFPSPH